MTKSYCTRVSAPAITQPEVANACPRDSTTRTNDVTHGNPPGTCVADRKRNKSGKWKNLLSCKKVTSVATQNVRSLRHQGKREELAPAFNNAKLNILGIVDHKLVHDDDEIQTEQLNKCTLITSSAWRNADGASSGGVGMLVSKTTESALAEIKSYNERIIIAHFNGNPMTTVIVLYSPTEGSQIKEPTIIYISDFHFLSQ